MPCCKFSWCNRHATQSHTTCAGTSRHGNVCVSAVTNGSSSDTHLRVQRQQGGGIPEPHDVDVGPDDVETAAHDLGDHGAAGPGGAPPVGVPPAESRCRVREERGFEISDPLGHRDHRMCRCARRQWFVPLHRDYVIATLQLQAAIGVERRHQDVGAKYMRDRLTCSFAGAVLDCCEAMTPMSSRQTVLQSMIPVPGGSATYTAMLQHIWAALQRNGIYGAVVLQTFRAAGLRYTAEHRWGPAG